MPLRYLSALVVALLTFTACTESEEDRAERARDDARSEVGEVVDSLEAAWAELDEQALEELIGADVAEGFVATAKRAERRGDVTSVVVEIDDAELLEVEPAEDTIYVAFEAPYEIEWTSEAAASPVAMRGDIDLGYSVAAESDGDGEDDESGEWSVALSEADLFPGFEGARSLIASYETGRRGAIKDRAGRVLAKGPAAERTYPFGTLAGSTIGHIGSLTKKDVKEGANGEVGDLYGASGLEEAFDERLAGLPSSRLDVVGAGGQKIATVGGIEGSPGENVKVTLDVEIQRAAEAAYGSTIGGAVVMQPQTGDLLAVVDSSTFGPGNYVGATDVEPFNRALSGGYPPGSSMKVVTAAAALDSKTVTPSSTVSGPKEYKGVRNFESGEFGSIPFSTAVKFSVNTSFAQVAEDLGGKKLTRYAELFGFNTEPAMALEARTSSFPEPVDLGDLMWSSVGQAQVLASPMQMASVVATIANDGKRMEPRIDLSQDPVGTRAVSQKAARELTAMMQSVVEGGTGTNARISGVAVAGKTGTAEVDVAGERRNHAWFVAFAPAGGPKLAVAVVAEYGGVGGQVAAPLARAILQRTLPLAP